MPKRSYDRIAVYEFLKTIITKKDDGSCVYTGDWNDSKVAQKYGIHRITAARIRESQFGPLEDPFRRKPLEPDASAAVSGFEHRPAKLESTHWDHGFTDRVTALENRMEAVARRIVSIEISMQRIDKQSRRSKQKARKS